MSTPIWTMWAGRQGRTACLSESDTDLDLSQIIYDYVCLSLPVQRVHEEGGCNPEALKFLNSEELSGKDDDDDSSLPFAALKSLLEKK